MKLADYVHDDRFFKFDPDTGVFESVRLATSRTDCKGYCGLPQLSRYRGQRILVAKYCQDGYPWLSIGAQRWRLYAPALDVTHEQSYWGFSCRFSIRRKNELLICFEYPRQDRLLSVIDSTYDDLDFSLAHLLADAGDYSLFSREQQLASFVKTWCSQSSAQPGAPADEPQEAVGRD